MKLHHALAVLVASSCLVAGCATTGSTNTVGGVQVRGAVGGLSANATGAASRDLAEEHGGSAIAGSSNRDDMHLNEAATFSGRDPQFAGPTPQVPIPRDGRSGNPAMW